MTSFARSTFSFAGYAAFRPTYGQALFRTVLAYHHQGQPGGGGHGPSGTLLDLGCGHGLISRALAPHFSTVVAVDPSPGMVAQAQKLNAAMEDQEAARRITVRRGSAEDLRAAGLAEDGSVDCVVSGQAAHWFDYARAWPELARVVRRGGTLAFWGYKDPVVVGQPVVSTIYERYVYGEEGEPYPGMESAARFWEMPGRGILRDSLRDVVPPDGDWTDVRRVAWDPDRATAAVGDAPPEVLWMRKTLRLGDLEGYLRTYSSISNWGDAHPEFRSRAQGGEGDLVDRMFDEIVAAVPAWQAKGERWRDVEVDVVWGTVLLMARRR